MQCSMLMLTVGPNKAQTNLCESTGRPHFRCLYTRNTEIKADFFFLIFPYLLYVHLVKSMTL